MRAIIRIAALRCPNLGLKTAFLFSEGVGEKEARDSKYSAPMFKSRKERSPLTPFQKHEHTSKQELEDIIAKINESNKYFMGIKLNTNYLKVHNIGKQEDILRQKVQNVTISDLPIEIAKEKKSFNDFDNFDERGVLESKAAQVAFGHCRKQKAVGRMQELIRQYVVALGSSGRFVNLQPNFQSNNIKLRGSLSERFTFKISQDKVQPQIKIKSVTLFKGLQVCRNDNYSTDSYGKDETEANEGIVTYTLYKQRKEMYPETEWLSMKRINVRFQLLVRGGPSIEVLENGASMGSSGNCVHNVVVESNMLVPPLVSEYQLTPQQYLRSYRLDRSNLVLTNFDAKNNFFGLTYSQNEKKTLLINAIQ